MGLLVPPSVAGLVANAAVTLDRRIAVNLNYTLPSDVLNDSLAQCGIRHVLTSRKFMERFAFDVHAELVYLEDLRDRLTLADKLVAGLQTWLLPAWVLERWLGLTRIKPDDTLTVIFTSGSTGRPKGVVLSHHNVGSNVEAFDQVLHLNRRDTLCGILPLFHSFGYTTTLWAAMKLEPKVAYHYNPLEPRQVGALCRQHRVTLLVSTPTFLRSYCRRCDPEDFATLQIVITGAEKLPRDVADAFERRFGVRPVEGYGTTELSPVGSTNIPPQRLRDPWHKGYKEGTVGQPLPGIAVKVVDLDTGEELGPGKSGMLLVKGSNVMQGYLHQPEQTAEVLRDGWYVTGDIAEIDEDGFIRITGRHSRFSKIGGEMVPHIRIEEALVNVLGVDNDEQVCLAVAAVPDSKKGERLVVFHMGLSKPPEQVCRDLAATGLPPLWIPSPESFCQVDHIPVLGTGKLDLKALKTLALAKFGPRCERPAADGL